MHVNFYVPFSFILFAPFRLVDLSFPAQSAESLCEAEWGGEEAGWRVGEVWGEAGGMGWRGCEGGDRWEVSGAKRDGR